MAKLLIVDDIPEVRSGIRRMLESLGHESVEAGGGHEALRALEADPYDLVLTDINMPDMDGIELILAVTERWPDLPVIALSGGGLLPKDLLLSNAELLGVVRTLEKPLGLSELEGAVNEALGPRGPPGARGVGS